MRTYSLRNRFEVIPCLDARCIEKTYSYSLTSAHKKINLRICRCIGLYESIQDFFFWVIWECGIRYEIYLIASS